MSNLKPSWSQWSIGEEPEIERSEQLNPPVENKKQAQNDEVADVKSATNSYEKLEDVDASHLRKEMYVYEESLIEEDVNNIIKNLQRKAPAVQESDEFKLGMKKFNVGSSKNINVPISAKKTESLQAISKQRLRNNRSYAKENLSNRSWKVNTQRVESQFSFNSLNNRKLSSNLALLFSKIAEERTGDKIAGRKKWDVNKVMFRRISKKLITQCKYSRDKEKIIILLDSSPSCSKMASLYSEISTEACRYEHVELYDAPNGHIHSVYSTSERKYVPLTDEELDNVYHWLGFEGRTIIYFGDEDGTSSLESSYGQNEIHWFFQGNRSYYTRRETEATMKRLHKQWDGKVKLYKCNTVNEIIKAVKEIK